MSPEEKDIDNLKAKGEEELSHLEKLWYEYENFWEKYILEHEESVSLGDIDTLHKKMKNQAKVVKNIVRAAKRAENRISK